MTKISVFKDKRKKIDLPILIDSRALICANSGGGKSVAIRKITEESHGKVMTIILDVEGEFKTLREKYDFLLIGQDGDVPINMKSANLLPAKLLELNVSTILDISDFKRHDRIMYVKKFLEALMELSRKYWKPCIVVVDEAHLYCGQQEKQESVHAVIDLMTRGRKRGFCGILCTQRIAKLHKDACAEANNYMIGRTGLDIDMKRAAEILGFTSKKDMLSLRDLDPGEFFVFGPAISKHVSKTKVEWVKTTHPKVGMKIDIGISPPTSKIKNILSKLADLPREAEEKLKTTQDLKKKIRELQFELRQKPKEVINNRDLEIAEKSGYNRAEKHFKKIIRESELSVAKMKALLMRISNITSNIPEIKPMVIPKVKSYKIEQKPVLVNKVPILLNKMDDIQTEFKLRAGAMKMLKAVAMMSPNSITKNQIAVLAGLSHKSGTFNTYLSELKRNDWIEESRGRFTITQEGINNAGRVSELPTEPEEILKMWMSKFRAGASRMLKEVANIYPNSITRYKLSENASMSMSSGTFNTYLSDLRRAGLIVIDGSEIRATKELFLED